MARRTSAETQKMNNKGSAQDIILVMAILFAAALIFLIGFGVTQKLDDGLQASSIVDARAKTASTKLTGYYPTVIDNSFLFLAIGLGTLTLVMAAMVRISPVFFFFFLLLWTFTIIVSAALSNVYEEASASTALAAEAAQLLWISSIMTYLPLVIGVFGGLLAIVMYSSWRNQ